jgi:hypothetical protein
MIIAIITFLVLNFIFAKLLIYTLINCCTIIVLNYPIVKEYVNDNLYSQAVKIYSSENDMETLTFPHIPILNIFFTIFIYLFTLLLKNKINQK